MTVFNTGPQRGDPELQSGRHRLREARVRPLHPQHRHTATWRFLEVFNSAYFSDVSLSDWLTHTPPRMVAQHLNVDAAVIAEFPADKPEVMPV